MDAGSPFRLPTHVRPLRYRLTLAPNLDDFTFRGEETIDLEVTTAIDRITLNAVELQVARANLVLADGSDLPASDISLDEGSETATFTFGRSIPTGEAALTIEFTGTLNDQLRGFYRSQYSTPDGQQRYLATTQFEATDARRAFPCWDEPEAKATFQVTLEVPSALAAISNMPIESERLLEGGLKAVTFAESPRMSTYLLALG